MGRIHKLTLGYFPRTLTLSTRFISTRACTMPRPSNWKSLAPFPPPATPSFQHQSDLQQLPIPSLSSTLTKLKDSLKPLARSPEEYRAAIAKIDEFGKPGGLGESLHKRLEQRRSERDHWLEEWWDDAAYLSYRDSVVINVSYYYGFSPFPPNISQSLPRLASHWTHHVLKFRERLQIGQILPDTVDKPPKEKPLCMDSWRWMFDCCRIPSTSPADYSVSYASFNGAEGANIIVVHKNRFWSIDVQDKTTGDILPPESLESAFAQILSAPDPLEPTPEIGLLTSLPRDDWAKAYNLLVKTSSHNAAVFKEIHRSAFVICLDSSSPKTVEEFSRALWHGGMPGPDFQLANRWCDKPLNFVLFQQSPNDKGEYHYTAGVLGEHSLMDGTPVARMCTDVISATISSSSAPISSSVPSSPTPIPLTFDIPSTLSTHLTLAQKHATELVSSHSLVYLLTPYGASLPKKYGVSPDSWVQMMVQLAFSRLIGEGKPLKKREGGTYEAATTRRFLRGRTEAIRVVSEQCDAFCEAMNEQSASKEKKIDLLRKAAAKHIVRAKEAGMARGIDRHLLGLKLARTPEEKEMSPSQSIFDDPLFQRGQTWQLSTSAIFSPYFPSYGWGEVIPDGFGVPYMTGYPDRFQITLTSRTHMPIEEFKQEILRAAEEMRLLFEDGKNDIEQRKSRL